MELYIARAGETCAAGASTADVMRLLSGGAAGAILMALGEGPLRTKKLTERVPGYTPRTIYRHVARLAEMQVVEREEEPGVPSKVVHTLTEDRGQELYELVNRYADAALVRLPDGRIDAQAWASLGLLADLWEAGMVERLACEPMSPTELAQGPHGLSYHQVNRRAGLFNTAGLVREWRGPGRRHRYALTEKTRRAMGLVVGIGRWRHRHVVGKAEEGMSAPEMATVLRTALPLCTLPAHAGKRLKLSVLGSEASRDDEVVWANVETTGSVHSCAEGGGRIHAWASGGVEQWVPLAIRGDLTRLEMGHEKQLVADCLHQLWELLWSLTSPGVSGLLRSHQRHSQPPEMRLEG